MVIRSYFCLPLLGLLSILLFAGGCSSPETIRSQSTTGTPTVDGNIEEWGGTLPSVGDGVSMGVRPTDSLLYVAVSIRDADLIRSVTENGLIVWVDPKNEQKRTYGVQYPLGLRSQGTGSDAERKPEESGSTTERVPQALTLDQMDVIRDGVVVQRIPAQFSSGLRAEVRMQANSMLYEVAIPVRGGAGGAKSHGLLAGLGSTVDVGLQTPETEDEPERPDRTTGVPSVTEPGRGTGRGPGRRGPGRRRGPQQGQQPAPEPEPRSPTLDLWARVVSK